MSAADHVSLPPIRCPWPDCTWEPIPRPIRTLQTNTADLVTHLLAAHQGRAPGCDEQGQPLDHPQARKRALDDLERAQQALDRSPLAAQSYTEVSPCPSSADDLLAGALPGQILGTSRPHQKLVGRVATHGRGLYCVWPACDWRGPARLRHSPQASSRDLLAHLKAAHDSRMPPIGAFGLEATDLNLIRDHHAARDYEAFCGFLARGQLPAPSRGGARKADLDQAGLTLSLSQGFAFAATYPGRNLDPSDALQAVRAQRLVDVEKMLTRAQHGLQLAQQAQPVDAAAVAAAQDLVAKVDALLAQTRLNVTAANAMPSHPTPTQLLGGPRKPVRLAVAKGKAKALKGEGATKPAPDDDSFTANYSAI
jgi:hypothetical protein